MVDFSKIKDHSVAKILNKPSLIWLAELHNKQKIEVGFSGGLDSSVLLHLLLKVREERQINLSAVHVNHNLSKNADIWTAYCQQICKVNNIPLRIEKINITEKKEGIESAARLARYQIYRQSQADIIALAQHFDDQAETVLLQMLRGGGIHAISAMPKIRKLNKNILLWRPLLIFTKEELISYAQEKNLIWIEDESNEDQSFTRNWLRHSIIPHINQYQPNYRQSLQRCAEQMADAASMVDDLSDFDLQQCSKEQRLNLASFFNLSAARQRHLLLRWAKLNELGNPTPSSLEDFRQQLIFAKIDRTPIWFLPNGKAHRYRKQLWPEIKKNYDLTPCQLISTKTLTLDNWGGQLVWQRAQFGISEKLLEQGLVLKLAETGAKISSNIGKKSLKNLFQEYSIPPFLRHRWPVIHNKNGDILALPSITISQEASCKNGWVAQWVYDKNT